MEYTITIPNENEKLLPAFDRLINRLGLHPKYNETKDGFIYEFTFSSENALKSFKETVNNEIPNLYPISEF